LGRKSSRACCVLLCGMLCEALYSVRAKSVGTRYRPQGLALAGFGVERLVDRWRCAEGARLRQDRGLARQVCAGVRAREHDDREKRRKRCKQ